MEYRPLITFDHRQSTATSGQTGLLALERTTTLMRGDRRWRPICSVQSGDTNTLLTCIAGKAYAGVEYV